MSLKHLPLELWEHILEDAISFDGNIALQMTCSPATYMAFKKASSLTLDDNQRVAYKEAEAVRRKLRLVCRAWNLFADNWKYRDRWLLGQRGSALYSTGSQYSQWNQPLRFDLTFRWAYGRSGVTPLHAWRD